MTSNDSAAPSLRQLNRAALIAAAAAAVIVTTVVLPAEYGRDPTGVGKLVGLTAMGEMKAAQAGGSGPAAPVAGDSVSSTADGGTQVRIVIGPYGGREVKAWMKAGGRMRYQWATDGAPVEFEFHGDPDNGKADEYSSYEKGRKASATGNFTAGFTGRHGWFWKNLSPNPVVVTATVTGAVEKFAPLYADNQTASAATKASARSDGTPYYTALPMKRLMAEVMAHGAQQVYKWQGYISDEQGSRSLFPKNDAEWKEAENAALSLAELSNLLLLPGRRVPEAQWDGSIAQLRTEALKTAAVARKRDKDGFMEAGSHIDQACQSCHTRYAPAVE